MSDGPDFYLPGWYLDSSGLLLPSSRPRPQAVDLPPELPPELIPPPAPTIVHSPPRPIDQWLVSIDETVLDLPEIPVMTLGRVRLLAAEIGFEPAMVMLARTAAHVMAIGGRGDQLQLAEWFY